MQILLRWLASAIALYITVLVGDHLHLGLYIKPGLEGVAPAIIAVAVLAIVNAVIRPIVKFLTLPITCLTLGLFTFVINAIMFWIVGQVVPGFHVKGFMAALFGSVVMSVFGGLLNWIVVSFAERGNKDEE
jgi:putative membrane protein